MSATCRLCGGRPDAEVVASWEFTVHRDAPSQNTLGSNSGSGRWSYRKERDTWHVLFLDVASKHRGDGLRRAAAPRRITITRRWSWPKKLRDLANVIGGLKPVVDAMVLAGLLVDDSPKWFEGFYRQERVERGGGTHILIEELGA